MSREDGVTKAAVISIVVVVLILIGAAGFFLKTRIDKLTAEPSPTPLAETPIATATSTPEPTPSFDKSKYTIRVLNGTKTSGLAASVSAKLKDLGYTIDKTGNATNSAFTNTVVRVKKDSSTGLLEQLIKDLSPDYSAKESIKLKDSDTNDAEIILGTE